MSKPAPGQAPPGKSAAASGPPGGDQWLDAQGEALRRSVAGEPLENCLEILLKGAMGQVEEASQSAIYIAPGPDMPLEAIAAVPPDRTLPSLARAVPGGGEECGPGNFIIITDEGSEADGDPLLELARRTGHRAAWSIPVHDQAGGVGGLVLFLYKDPLLPAEPSPGFTRSLRAAASMLLAHDAARANLPFDSREALKSLHESQRKYQSLFESMDEAYAVVEVLKDEHGQWSDFRFVEVNPAFMVHSGMADPVGKTASEVLGGPNPRWSQLYGEVVDSGRPVRIQETDSSLARTFDLNIFRLDRDRARVAVLFTNVTRRRRAEEALRESEERKAFLLKLNDAISTLTSEAEIMETASCLLGERLGVDRISYGDIEGEIGSRIGTRKARHVRREDELAVGPDAPAKLDGWVLEQLREGRPVDVADVATDPRIDDRTRADLLAGGTRSMLAIPLRRSGLELLHLGVQHHEPRSWSAGDVQLLSDVADRTFTAAERTKSEILLRREKRRQETLLAELQHRVRNTLAVIRSIVRRTGATSANFEEFQQHLDGRLGAFARTQAYVTRDPEGGVDLELIIRDELLAHAAGDDEHMLIGGPRVRLNARQAETIGLAVHELASNAVKHGALASAGDHIEVSWSLVGEGSPQMLHFSWRERVTGRTIEPPGRSGFGTELLDRVLSYELDARTSIQFLPDGLSYVAEIPLSDPVSPSGAFT